jgi:Restriction Enzyme Adenine Methylase Associated
MQQIEIDFDVFKELTNRRTTEAVTYNDVIRELLGLQKLPKSPANGGKPWAVSGTSFPAGSQFMADYKGKNYSGTVRDGKLELDGRRFSTPSAAAVYVKGHNANGWRFWKCKLPGASQFVPIERLRGKTH